MRRKPSKSTSSASEDKGWTENQIIQPMLPRAPLHEDIACQQLALTQPALNLPLFSPPAPTRISCLHQRIFHRIVNLRGRQLVAQRGNERLNRQASIAVGIQACKRATSALQPKVAANKRRVVAAEAVLGKHEVAGCITQLCLHRAWGGAAMRNYVSASPNYYRVAPVVLLQRAQSICDATNSGAATWREQMSSAAATQLVDCRLSWRALARAAASVLAHAVIHSHLRPYPATAQGWPPQMFSGGLVA